MGSKDLETPITRDLIRLCFGASLRDKKQGYRVTGLGNNLKWMRSINYSFNCITLEVIDLKSREPIGEVEWSIKQIELKLERGTLKFI